MKTNNMNKKGYVYILTNDAFIKDCIKIGMTKNLDERLKQLDTTAVPLPFKPYAVIETEEYDKVEAEIHRLIDGLTNYRFRKNREYFKMLPEDALKLFMGISVLVKDGNLVVYNDKDKKEEFNDLKEKIGRGGYHLKEKRVGGKPRFKFSMVDIYPGYRIIFEPTGVYVNVISDTKIEYKGKQYTLSSFTEEFIPDNKKFPCGRYDGPKFFSYNGKNLFKLREELEHNNELELVASMAMS